jgi:hypothetical protein
VRKETAPHPKKTNSDDGWDLELEGGLAAAIEAPHALKPCRLPPFFSRRYQRQRRSVALGHLASLLKSLGQARSAHSRSLKPRPVVEPCPGPKTNHFGRAERPAVCTDESMG